jgi:spermidine synthase
LLRFKKILSYLVDIQLDKASTDLNPVLDLSLRKGRFYLTTTNAVYSYGDLYDNFLKAFQQIDFRENKFEKLLVLGFGLGSVPFMLERVFHQRFTSMGVEADAKVLEWAQRYALPELANPIQLTQADAFVFVENCKEKFDLIVMDVFLDDLVPTQFDSANFLEKTKALLSEKGLLLFNRLADTEAALESTHRFYETTFKSVFSEGNYLDVSGNWILANKRVFK